MNPHYEKAFSLTTDHCFGNNHVNELLVTKQSIPKKLLYIYTPKISRTSDYGYIYLQLLGETVEDIAKQFDGWVGTGGLVRSSIKSVFECLLLERGFGRLLASTLQCLAK